MKEQKKDEQKILRIIKAAELFFENYEKIEDAILDWAPWDNFEEKLPPYFKENGFLTQEWRELENALESARLTLYRSKLEMTADSLINDIKYFANEIASDENLTFFEKHLRTGDEVPDELTFYNTRQMFRLGRMQNAAILDAHIKDLINGSGIKIDPCDIAENINSTDNSFSKKDIEESQQNDRKAQTLEPLHKHFGEVYTRFKEQPFLSGYLSLLSFSLNCLTRFISQDITPQRKLTEQDKEAISSYHIILDEIRELTDKAIKTLNCSIAKEVEPYLLSINRLFNRAMMEVELFCKTGDVIVVGKKEENADTYCRGFYNSFLNKAKSFVGPLVLLATKAEIETQSILDGTTTETSNNVGTDLTDTEQNILETLGKDTLKGEPLLKKAGYSHSSHYKTILSNLVKRNILKNIHGKGYQRSQV